MYVRPCLEEYRAIELDKRIYIKDSSVRCVSSPRSIHLLKTRVHIVLVTGASLFFIVRDSLSLFFEHFGACKSCLPVARAFFFWKRGNKSWYVIKTKKKIDVYILRRYYVVYAIMCECIYVQLHVRILKHEKLRSYRDPKCCHVVFRRKFNVDYIRLSSNDTVDVNNNL